MTWRPFGKKKTEDSHDPQGESSAEHTPQDFGKDNSAITEKKNAPTPKRNVAQAKNIHPLVPDRQTSKEEYKRAKNERRERQNEEYAAMQTGDIAHMPKAERLASRVYIRDYVDARFNLGEIFIPVIIVIFIAFFAVSAISGYASTIVMMLIYVYLIAVVIDTAVMWQKLKKRLNAKFGPKTTARGSRTASYAWSRAIQMRRWRMPKPRTKKRGQWPK
jgi:hypothetical protein